MLYLFYLGIHVVSIGFGTVGEEELYNMATDTDSVKFVENFEDLTVQELLNLSCACKYHSKSRH